MEATNERLHSLFEKQQLNRLNISLTDATERRNKLKKLLNIILNSQREICDAVYKDFRKSGQEVKLSEIFPVTSDIKHVIRNLNKWMKPKRVPAPLTFFGSKNRIIYESIGHSLIIAPWNFPFMLAVGPLVSAIAAGNTVIIKPSEKSPNTSELIKKMVSGIFAEEEAAVIEGGAEVSKELVSLPFDHIFFTGGTEVGKSIMAKASGNLCKVTLELGGKSPAIIDENADIKSAAERITWGKFMNAGQTCNAPDYILVHETWKAELLSEIKKSLRKYYGDDPRKSKTYCRLINKSHYEKVKDLLEDAEKNGAGIITGGETIDNENYISPTVLDNVQLHSAIMKEEIFGPLLPVISYKTDDEIFNIVNINRYPLAMYIFSKKKKFIKKTLRNIPAGTSAINDVVVQFVNYNLPFGGINRSGSGKAHGYYGFKTFSNEKSFMKQPKITPIMFLYPPYNRLKNRLIDIVIKYF